MAKKASKKKIGKASRPKASRKAKSKALSLGRPLVTSEEDLDMLFHDEFDARQVFKYLQARTVKELEQFSPEQIVRLLSKPIRNTVDRIRQRLAEKNRHLLEDLDFALQWQKQHPRE